MLVRGANHPGLDRFHFSQHVNFGELLHRNLLPADTLVQNEKVFLVLFVFCGGVSCAVYVAEDLCEVCVCDGEEASGEFSLNFSTKGVMPDVVEDSIDWKLPLD